MASRIPNARPTAAPARAKILGRAVPSAASSKPASGTKTAALAGASDVAVASVPKGKSKRLVELDALGSAKRRRLELQELGTPKNQSGTVALSAEKRGGYSGCRRKTPRRRAVCSPLLISLLASPPGWGKPELAKEEGAVETPIEGRGEGRGRVCAWWMRCVACVLAPASFVEAGEDEYEEGMSLLVDRFGVVYKSVRERGCGGESCGPASRETTAEDGGRKTESGRRRAGDTDGPTTAH
ncbi:hypothetical protein DFH08DRAFT_817063 [Mycena albidolilacea]|uniref:Uncharacterized protein n=1 Tax=Mycena albidolilacea TaxID=1033008 RepID=A0AAD7EH23_9AGAR|nr:hypothetical protein DFH08DRAFT_817063 [Mycena albidolilacea]